MPGEMGGTDGANKGCKKSGDRGNSVFEERNSRVRGGAFIPSKQHLRQEAVSTYVDCFWSDSLRNILTDLSCQIVY